MRADGTPSEVIAPTSDPEGVGRRRLTLLDGMILVAATAAGLAGTRVVVAFILDPDTAAPPGARVPWVAYLAYWPLAGVPALLAGSWAVLLMRLRPPRPSWMAMGRQAGPVACLVAALISALQVVKLVAGWALARVPGMTFPGSSVALYSIGYYQLSGVGQGVVGAWLVLVLAGRWGLGSTWLDRAGCLLGMGWIGLALLHELSMYIV